ncbi:MAG: beta-galactosidase trimerization domain-containing protein, partial [Anaerolineae bacterium]
LFSTLDAVGIDIYASDPYEVAFYADLCRSIGPLWVLEYGSQLPGIREGMDLLTDHGCEWLTFFKFNPTPAGQEQNTAHLLTVTGESTRNYEVVRTWAAAREEPLSVETEDEQRPTVGMLYDFESSWVHAIAAWNRPYREQLRYANYLIHTVYRTLFEIGLEVRFVRTYEDMSECDAVLMPWQIVYDEGLEKALIRYVENGGRLIATDDLFHKNRDNVYLTKVPRTYRALLNWRESRFPKVEDEWIMGLAGDGRAWLIRADANADHWRTAVGEALAGVHHAGSQGIA